MKLKSKFFLTGNQYMTNFGLWPLTRGYSKTYMDNIDPRITNEFATAAFRYRVYHGYRFNLRKSSMMDIFG